MAPFAGTGAGQDRATISGLIDRDRFKFCWIVDFPMYEWDEEDGKIDFCHNPVLDAAGRVSKR